VIGSRQVMFSDIPIADVGSLVGEGANREEVEKLAQVARNEGSFYIENHGRA